MGVGEEVAKSDGVVALFVYSNIHILDIEFLYIS